MNKKNLIAIMLMLFFIFPIFSENKEINKIDQWRKALKYGTTSTVFKVIKEMQQENNYKLSSDLLPIFSISTPKVKIAIIDFFIKKGDDNRLTTAVEENIINFKDYSVSLISKELKYIDKVEKGAGGTLLDSIYDICYEDSLELSKAAISVLGNIKSSEDFLMKLYQESTTVKQAAIIEALGKLKSKKAEKMIIKTLKNEVSDNNLKYASAKALGLIGGNLAFNTLKKTLTKTSNAYLKSVIISSLTTFNASKSKYIYIEGLKDDFWQIRIASINGIKKNKLIEAVPYLEYISYNDVNKNVRTKAWQALISMKQTQSIENIFKNKEVSDSIKSELAMFLVSSDAEDFFKVLLILVNQELEKKERTSIILRGIAKGFNKKLKSSHDELVSALLKTRDNTALASIIEGIRINNWKQFKSRIEKINKYTASAKVKGASKKTLYSFT